MIKHKDGKLLKGEILFRQSPHHKDLFKPHYIVIHYTEGRTAEGAIVTLTQKDFLNNASVHLVMDTNGEIIQPEGLQNRERLEHFYRFQGCKVEKTWFDLSPLSIGMGFIFSINNRMRLLQLILLSTKLKMLGVV